MDPLDINASQVEDASLSSNDCTLWHGSYFSLIWEIFHERDIEKWTKNTSSNFSREMKTKTTSSVLPHGFNKVTILKFQVFVTAGPSHLFNAQVVKFAKELTNLWEIPLPKEMGILPIAENASKCVITDNVPEDANAVKPWVFE